MCRNTIFLSQSPVRMSSPGTTNVANAHGGGAVRPKTESIEKP
jgi:hypothetical protein